MNPFMAVVSSDVFRDVLPIIQKYAPTIGQIIGGPYGFSAGYALSMVASAFNTTGKSIPSLAKAILDDPDAQVKLEQLEHEHSDWLPIAEQSMGRLTSAEINVKLAWAEPK